eukprot:scaffold66415_cov28-Attheya_sp.AAC.1
MEPPSLVALGDLDSECVGQHVILTHGGRIASCIQSFGSGMDPSYSKWRGRNPEYHVHLCHGDGRPTAVFAASR